MSETVWECGNCGAELARGPFKPQGIAKCPKCGVTFRNTAAGMMEGMRERQGGWGGNPPAQNPNLPNNAQPPPANANGPFGGLGQIGAPPNAPAPPVRDPDANDFTQDDNNPPPGQQFIPPAPNPSGNANASAESSSNNQRKAAGRTVLLVVVVAALIVLLAAVGLAVFLFNATPASAPYADRPRRRKRRPRREYDQQIYP